MLLGDERKSMMNISAIPKDVLKVLEQRSSGGPWRTWDGAGKSVRGKEVQGILFSPRPLCFLGTGWEVEELGMKE